MKHLLAATTFAALLAAAPAGAQTLYGGAVGAQDIGTDNAGAGVVPGGNWKDIWIYGSAGPATAPDLVLPGNIATDTATGAAFAARNTTDVATAVPEPATWAMMLMGFGAVGGALRSRRKATLRHA